MSSSTPSTSGMPIRQPIQLIDLFDITELQDFQNLFADATGVASIITLPDGKPITHPSNFRRLYSDLVQGTDINIKNCLKSDSLLGVKNTTGPTIHKCRSCGIWSAGAGIVVDGVHIANWLIGQVRSPEIDFDTMAGHAEANGVNREQYLKALEKMPIVTDEKFNQVSNLLFSLVKQLSDKAYKNLQHKIKINELEQTLSLLSQSEDRFEALFNQAPLGYQSLDMNGNIIEVNDSWVEMLGYSRSEAIGKWFGDFVAPSFHDKLKHNFEVFKENGHIHCDYELVHKNGQNLMITFDGKIAYNTDRTVKQTHCILKDITLLTQAQSALLASNEKHRTILKTAINGFWITDTNGNIKEVNDRYCQMSGYSEAELLSMHISELDVNESVQLTEKHIDRIKQKGEDRFESAHRRKDGSIYDVEVVAQYNQTGQNVLLIAFIQDITQRKNTDRKLKQTTQTYLDIFNTVSEAIYIQDVSGIFIEVNKGAEKLYKCKREDLIGQSPLSVSAPGLNNLKEIERISKEVFATGKPARFEFWAKRKNDEIFRKDVIVNKGKYFGRDILIATARDITQQKLNEQTIKESEEKFRMIFSESPIGIELYDANGLQMNANQASLDMFGIPDVKEILNFNLFSGTSLNDKLKEQLRKGIGVSYQSEFNFDKVRSLNQYKTKRLGTAFFDFNIKPLFGDDHRTLSGYLLHVQDITKRIQTEQEIALLAHSLESVNECVSITDLNNNISYVNKAFVKTYGYEKDELLGKNIAIVRSEENDPESLNKILTATLKDGWLGEIFNKTKSGRIFPILLSTKVIKDIDGKTLGLIGVSKDITEQKKQVKELIEARKKAEESDRLKSAFLANMSHEIRTPMNGILGFTELLKKPTLSGEKQNQYIDIIDKSGQRMLNVINDIISISKVEAGEMEIVLTETNINSQLDYLNNFFKPEVDQKGVKLLFNKPLRKTDSIVQTDQEKVYAILTNLIKNAIKFTHKGSIEFGCERKDEFLEFFVKDSGSGIEPNQKQVIFERFRQGSESLTRNYEGAGLGLSICKAYTKMLGGQIWVESIKNVGSTFFFTIPYQASLAPEVVKEKTATSKEKTSDINGLKILVAEDDQTSEWLIKLLVKRFSREIMVAKTGLESVEICEKNPDIDLILMDIKMTVMDGLQATKRIREFNNEVIIFAQTAYALVGDREIALEAGCNEYLPKPLNHDLLTRLIDKYFHDSASCLSAD